jgi:hypothetical protein
MVTKIQNGGQKSKWRQMVIFLSKKRVKRHLSGNLLTIFGWNSLNIDPTNILSHLNTTVEFQDGVKDQKTYFCCQMANFQQISKNCISAFCSIY